MSKEVVAAGTPVTYWGQARGLYGVDMVIKWANVCGCKHQTYCLEYEDEDGTMKQLEQVLETSFTVRPDNG